MMAKTKIELNNPCPYCGGKSFSAKTSNYALLAVKEGTPPVIDTSEGLIVAAAICKECGYTMFFSSNSEK